MTSGKYGVLGIVHSPAHEAIFALAWTDGSSGDSAVLRLDDNATAWRELYTFPTKAD